MASRARRPSRRGFLLGAGALVPGVLLAACDPRGGGGPPALSTRPVTLELATDWNSPQRKAILDTMRAEFTRQHPHVTVNHQHVEAGSSSAQGYTEMMVTQLSAGTIADVVANWAYVPFVEQLADLTRDAPRRAGRRPSSSTTPSSRRCRASSTCWP